MSKNDFCKKCQRCCAMKKSVNDVVLFISKSLKTYKIYQNHYYYKGTVIEGIGGLDSFLRSLGGKLIYFRGKGFEYHSPDQK